MVTPRQYHGIEWSGYGGISYIRPDNTIILPGNISLKLPYITHSAMPVLTSWTMFVGPGVILDIVTEKKRRTLLGTAKTVIKFK